MALLAMHSSSPCNATMYCSQKPFADAGNPL